MNIIKCHKCGTAIFTGNEAIERLKEEYDDLQKEMLKLESIIPNKQGGEKTWLCRKLNEKRGRSRDIKFELKQLNNYLHIQNQGVNDIFCDILREELHKFGYTKENFKEFNRIATEKYNKLMAEYNHKLQELYAPLNEGSKHNKWHNSKGQYDPTTALALKAIK